ncbi:MAG: hypothetical protein A2156_04805 [Deltaproteobacteria bacterium RBG_16_48_10]|nr:MAG: hypothetical protein A2156_04805 [Deltaproteobacteria bacterium RBG_16_48_10]
MKRFFIPILITLGIFILLFTQISPGDIYALLSRINLQWAFLGALAYLLAILFRALRYKWLIHSRDIPLSDLFRISIFYHLSLMVLPSKLGELSYPYFLNKLNGMTMTEGLASLIASRIYDFFTLLLFFFIAFIGFQGLFHVHPFLMILFMAILTGLTFLAFFYTSRLLKLCSKMLEKVSQRVGLSHHKSLQWALRKIHDMAEDFYAIQARRTYLPVTLASLASWVFSYLMFYAFLRGFGISTSFMNVVFGSTIAIIANILPISGLGNWGVLEAGWAAGFILVGLSKVDAIATGFGVHIILFLTATMASFLGWITLKKR